MTSSPSSAPTGLLDTLYLGAVRWDLTRPFPQQDPVDLARGDTVHAVLADLLHAHVDPTEVERCGRLPDGLRDRLREAGLFGLTMPAELGGLELSPMNALRVVEAAASWCMPVSWALAITNGFGAGNYLPLLGDGPLRELILAEVRAGTLFGTADSETIGAANSTRRTTATPVDGGAAYLINGEKIFIGNAGHAGLVDVSATLHVNGVEQVRIFFVTMDSPGVELAGSQQFMGLRGADIGVLRFTDARVPAERLLPAKADQWRDEPALAQLAILGRTLVITAPSLAIAKLCLTWTRDFVNRREMDGRGLADYDEIQRLVVQNAADVFAMQSMAEWSLLGADVGEKVPEFTAVKNLMAMACWRVVDRTIDLLAGEGFETAESKARRGAVPLPVERFARDARGLRIAGGVDFLLDYWSALGSIGTTHRSGEALSAPDPVTGPQLPAALARHVQWVEAEAGALADRAARLAKAYPAEELAEREHLLVLLGRIARGLLSMSVVLARAEHLNDPLSLALAGAACTEEERRIAAARAELDGDEPDHAELSRWVLQGALSGVLGEGPPASRPG